MPLAFQLEVYQGEEARQAVEWGQVIETEGITSWCGAVTDKGLISFAARGSRGAGKADRRESDETAR
jgi:hypothetical protein